MSCDKQWIAALLEARKQWQNDGSAQRENESPHQRVIVQQHYFLQSTEILIVNFQNWCKQNGAEGIAWVIEDLHQSNARFFKEHMGGAALSNQISQIYFNRLSLLNRIVSNKASLKLFNTYLSLQDINYDHFISEKKTLKDTLLDVAEAFNDKKQKAGLSNQ